MAHERRHAAWQTEYDVREAVGGDRSGTPVSRHRCFDYAEAVEFALDFLDANDPTRDGTIAGMTVDRVVGTRRETIWSYDAADADDQPPDPISVFGYDVTRRWIGPTYRAA